MPKTDSENKKPITFHAPMPLLQEAIEIADLEGWTPAEFHRLCWEAGLAVQAEKSNKRLVNKGLRQKQKPEKSASDT
jgi:hypothetical protein